MHKAAWLLAILVLILLAVNLALFLPSLEGDFLWDDKYFVSENPALLSPYFLRDFLTSPFGGFSGTDENSRKSDESRQFYRPLTSLSYWLDFKVWGLNPAAFHLTNVLLHFLDSVLLFLILARLKFSPAASLASALLFSAFPLHFENVAWISGRADLLCFTFAAVSVLFFLRFLSGKKSFDPVFSGLFFLLSLLSKETVVFLPVIYFLVLYKKETGAPKILFPLWPCALSLLGWFILRWSAFGSAQAGFSGRPVFDLLAALGFYMFKMVFPFDLSVTVNALAVFGNEAFVGLGLVAVLSFIVSAIFLVRNRRQKAGLSFAFFSGIVLLLPALAILFSSATISLLAWRFLYLPSAVYIAGLVYFLQKKIRPRVAALAVLGVFLAFSAAEIFPKNRLFGEDDTNFWLKIKGIDREDVIAKFNQGIKLLPQDERKALALFEGILGRKDHPLAGYWTIRIYEELAIYFAFQKDFPKAQYYFDELLKMQPTLSLHASLNYAYFLAFSGREPEGEKIVLGLVQKFPRNHFVLVRAAKFYLIVKNYRKAAQLYGEDYRLFGTSETLRLLQGLEPLLREKGG